MKVPVMGKAASYSTHQATVKGTNTFVLCWVSLLSPSPLPLFARSALRRKTVLLPSPLEFPLRLNICPNNISPYQRQEPLGWQEALLAIPAAWKQQGSSRPVPCSSQSRSRILGEPRMEEPNVNTCRQRPGKHLCL